MTAEVRPGNGQTAERMLGKERPQNAFVDFVAQKQSIIVPMFEAYEDIRTEINGWKNSESFDRIVDTATEIYRKSFTDVGRNFNEQQQKQWLRRFLNSMWFSFTYIGDTSKGSKAIDNFHDKVYRIVGEDDSDRMGEESKRFNSAYKASTDPLKKDYFEREDQVLETLEGFFLEDFGGVRDFADFLSGPNFSRDREENRILLRAIAGEKDIRDRSMLLDRVAQRVKETEKENPKPEILFRVIKDKTKKPQSPVWKWIEFSSRVTGVKIDPASDESIMAAARALVRFSPFPPELQADLSFKIDQSVNDTVAEAKRGLANYAPRIEHVPMNPPMLSNRQNARALVKNRDVAAISAMKTIQAEEESPEESNKPYNVGLLVETPDGMTIDMSQETINKLIERSAVKFARGDVRMKNDVEALIKSITKNPFGYGTVRIGYATTFVDNKRLTFRSFKPNQRPDLTLEHEGTQSLRLVYVVDARGEERKILIEDFYNHADYERRFKF